MNPLVTSVTLDQAAKWAAATISGALSERREVLASALLADCEGQVWTVGDPDALGMTHEIKGAVEADADRRRALFAVVLEGADQRVRWAEAEITRTAIHGNHHGRLDLLDQIGLVIPLRRIGWTATGRGVLIDEKEAHELVVLESGDVPDGPYSGAKFSAGLGSGKRANVPLCESRVHHPPRRSCRMTSKR